MAYDKPGGIDANGRLIVGDEAVTPSGIIVPLGQVSNVVEPGDGDVTITFSRTGILVDIITWRTAITNVLLKTAEYTYSGNYVVSKVMKIYDVTGVIIVSQRTYTYNYTGLFISSIDVVKDI